MNRRQFLAAGAVGISASTTTPTEQHVDPVRKLLDEAAAHFSDLETAPSGDWWKRYFQLTGEHMLLTGYGWESGEAKAVYIADGDADSILDEVNPR